jgi:hypothetical protein
MILSLGRLAIVSLWIQSCIRKRVKMSTKIKWKNIEQNKTPKLSVMQDCMYDALILYRVEQWLKGEINDNKNQYPQRSDAEEDRILSGRLECAEGLSNLISTWRKELRGLE